jgi:hypothetical protein
VGGARSDSGSTRSASWVGLASADEVSVPAQQSGRLDEESSPVRPREEPRQAGKQRTVGWSQSRSFDLAAQYRHLVTQDDDLDRQIVLSTAREADELDHADERQVEERKHHKKASSLPGPWH